MFLWCRERAGQGEWITEHQAQFFCSILFLLFLFPISLSWALWLITQPLWWFMTFSLLLLLLLLVFGFVEMVWNGLWWQQEWLSLMDDGMMVWIEWLEAVGWMVAEAWMFNVLCNLLNWTLTDEWLYEERRMEYLNKIQKLKAIVDRWDEDFGSHYECQMRDETLLNGSKRRSSILRQLETFWLYGPNPLAGGREGGSTWH